MKKYDSSLILFDQANHMHDIHKVRNLLGLRFRSEGEYSGVYTTGNSGIGDYGVGLLELHIRVSKSHAKEDEYTVRFSFLTIDDGGWGAWLTSSVSKSEAIERVDKLAFEFVSFMERSYVLPSEKDLNEFLMKHELWGCPEG
jgi:hypothetical protein